jgi:hypothetical protein
MIAAFDLALDPSLKSPNEIATMQYGLEAFARYYTSLWM